MKLKHIWYLGIALLMVQLVACDDEWDKHYNDISTEKIDMNIPEYIKSQTDWSIFYQMLEKTGYDTILNASLTYTVWVPVNSALENVDLNDEELVLNIVEGHIARFTTSTSGISSERIYMMSEKYNTFYESGSDFKLVDATILTRDAIVNNGAVHSIDEYVPYISSIWEYLGITAGIDSLGKFAYAQDFYEFDPINSVKIGEDDDGQPFYDTAFNYSNKVISLMGKLDDEDSLYTVILPKNSAWIAGYKKLKKLFVISQEEGGEKMQDYVTGLAILKHLTFEGLLTNPEAADSLRATSGKFMKDPARLFSYTEKVSLSNGNAYLADSFNISLAEAGYKTLVVEAESQRNLETSNCEVTAKSSLGTGVKLSNDGYLDVTFTGSKFSGAGVSIPIPNTLSTKYNIYCVFVPFNLEGGNVIDKTRVKFTLNYEDANGNSEDIRLKPENDETDTTSVTKMLVGQFEFPVANVQVDPDEYPEVKVSLEIQNTMTDRNKKDGYSLDMRIDAIILEPVE